MRSTFVEHERIAFTATCKRKLCMTIYLYIWVLVYSVLDCVLCKILSLYYNRQSQQEFHSMGCCSCCTMFYCFVSLQTTTKINGKSLQYNFTVKIFIQQLFAKLLNYEHFERCIIIAFMEYADSKIGLSHLGHVYDPDTSNP